MAIGPAGDRSAGHAAMPDQQSTASASIPACTRPCTAPWCSSGMSAAGRWMADWATASAHHTPATLGSVQRPARSGAGQASNGAAT
jgi:hypothetical protein